MFPRLKINQVKRLTVTLWIKIKLKKIIALIIYLSLSHRMGTILWRLRISQQIIFLEINPLVASIQFWVGVAHNWTFFIPQRESNLMKGLIAVYPPPSGYSGGTSVPLKVRWCSIMNPVSHDIASSCASNNHPFLSLSDGFHKSHWDLRTRVKLQQKRISICTDNNYRIKIPSHFK